MTLTPANLARDAADLRAREIAERLELLGPPESTPGLAVRLCEPLARHTTLRLGGPADVFVEVASGEALSSLLGRAHREHIAVTCLGAGSNLLIRDGGIRGLVVHLGGLRTIARVRGEDEEGATLLDVDAGASTGSLLRAALEGQLGGLEFLGGVPGTVGGGLIMNAGTYLGEFTQVVRTVTGLDDKGQPFERAHDDCGFGYRRSGFAHEEILVRTRLRLTHRPREAIAADVTRLRERRRAREPSRVRNAGSTFKNPEGDFAGRLIEAAGLKGTRVGAALVSEVHANWLVIDPASGCAPKSRDLSRLIEIVAGEVSARFGVTLVPEVKILGEDDPIEDTEVPCGTPP